MSRTDEIPPMSMKRIEIDGIEIAIINLGGKFFAIRDRCGHMNAPLSRGQIMKDGQGKSIVVCPLHGSTFDIETGKNLTGPVKPPAADMSAVPKPVLDSLARAAELSALIKVFGVETFQIEQQGSDVRLNMRHDSSQE